MSAVARSFIIRFCRKVGIPEGPDRGLGSVRNANFPQDGLHVELHSRFADRMDAANHLVRIAAYKRLQDLLLTLGKSVPPVIRISAVNSTVCRRADGARHGSGGLGLKGRCD